jgi:4'-phosphopantetheinyl transferase
MPRPLVGIDVEASTVEMASVTDVARRSFSEREYDAVLRAPDPCRVFLELWTRKEAVVKAMGVGMAQDLLVLTFLIPRMWYCLVSGKGRAFIYAISVLEGDRRGSISRLSR